jgi:chorismate mutase
MSTVQIVTIIRFMLSLEPNRTPEIRFGGERQEGVSRSAAYYHQSMLTRSATAGRNRLLAVWLVAVLASGCATTARFNIADTAAVDQLLGLIRERLEVSPAVARVKWNTRAPIEDPSREREIIDGVARQATEYGLDSALAGRFFRGQIEASKTVQNRLHAEWRASNQLPFAEVADLQRDVRPVLDRLTPMLLRALAGALPVIQQRGGRHLLETRYKALFAEIPGAETAMRQAVTPLQQLGR